MYALTSVIFVVYIFVRSHWLSIVARALYICMVAIHLIFMILLVSETGTFPLASPGEFMNMMILVASLVMLFFVFSPSTFVLAAFYLPVATFVLNLGLCARGLHTDAALHAYKYLFPLHTVSVTLGEAFFVIAAIISMVYLVHEGIIRRGDIYSPVAYLPPLAVLDRMLYLFLSLGFIALTIGMIFGGYWIADLDISMVSIAPRIASGAVMWFVFGLSLHQRIAIGWKGRRIAIITLAGCIVMAALFIGSYMFFPQAHGTGLLE